MDVLIFLVVLMVELAIYIAVYGGIFIVSIASYVLNALGLQTIAKRRGIDKPWLAWIPIANGWILGSISDQYQQMMKNKETKRRKLLVMLDIVTMVLVILFFVFYFGMFIVIMVIGIGSDSAGMSPEVMLGPTMIYVIGFYGFGAILSVASIVQRVFFCICDYDLYMSCNPDKAPIFLVLSIVVGITRPVLVFICRNKDDGMLVPEDAAQPEPEEFCELPEHTAAEVATEILSDEV